ncbi:hypothetical protein IGI04_005651 [Brassica rapa subsp. trilocularis]|uniref:Tify domain-containing protein n=3 Tax=Brassica TaxID=3705 RepID=A0A3P6C3V2_BRACM|nr:GATA transcription factor 25-like [Brassica napus]KAG5409332.1 hypothetical protein IGI04_005651 [Brassica rapa subsp. trilocularis]CAG7897042.1 unnamed protein product [Brassica rapa]CAF2093374.1 unnamed protein product [Brassica napus]CAF2137875.1 unnamed protein product [Brassica napus]VDD03192.1 unnamed protein product [Brassica rapa]
MFGHHTQPEINPNQIGSSSATVGEDHVSTSATSAGHIPYDDMDDIPHPDSIYAASDLIPDGSHLVPHRFEGSELLGSRPMEGANELTISFCGQVYVFDAVGPEKINTLRIGS